MSTANHIVAMWDFLGGTIQNLVRGYPCDIYQPETEFFSFKRPYAFPVPVGAVDRWGVGYPADAVAIAWSAYIEDAPGTDYNSALEEFWFGPGLAGYDGPQSYVSIAVVPGVLPIGYTLNNFVEWTTNFGDTAGQYWWWNYRRTADSVVGLTAGQPWFPVNPAGEDAGGITWIGTGTYPATLATGPTVYAGYNNLTAVGFRKVQIRITGTPATSGGVSATGTVNIILSHNADGSMPGGGFFPTGDGDTTDFTYNITVGSFSGDTGWIDAGAISPTLGVLSNFICSIGSTGINETGLPPFTSPFATYSIELHLSQRCDIPFPTTIIGQGNLIAPGGYLP